MRNFDKNSLACTQMRNEVRKQQRCKECRRSTRRATEHCRARDHSRPWPRPRRRRRRCFLLLNCAGKNHVRSHHESTDRGGSAPSEPACAGIFPRVLGVERVARCWRECRRFSPDCSSMCSRRSRWWGRSDLASCTLATTARSTTGASLFLEDAPREGWRVSAGSRRTTPLELDWYVCRRRSDDRGG